MADIKYSIDELLDKFPNGLHRYLNDPLFCKCMQAMASGATTFEIMDTLFKIIEEKNSIMADLSKRKPIQYIIPAEGLDPKLLEEIKSKTKAEQK